MAGNETFSTPPSAKGHNSLSPKRGNETWQLSHYQPIVRAQEKMSKWRGQTKHESDIQNHSQSAFVDRTLQGDRIIASIGSGQGVGHSDGTCRPQACKHRRNPSGCGKRRQFSLVAHASTRSYHT